MDLFETTRRALGVLALVVGVLAMHAVAGAHDSHASSLPVAASQPVLSLHASPHSEVAGAAAPVDETATAIEPAGVLAICHAGCPTDGGGLAEICLMVLTSAFLVLLAARHLRILPLHHLAARAPSVRRAVTTVARPPSLAVLCISRT